MAIQNLTYAELGEIWGVSKDAARKKVEGLRLPRTRGNDGRARVQIDLEEVTHTPLRPKSETSDEDRGEGASGDREETAGSPSPEIRALQARVEDLASDLERERAETKRERDERLEERSRADRLAGDLAKLAGRLADAERANGAAEKDVALARAEGDKSAGCTTCTGGGTLKQGFRATVVGGCCGVGPAHLRAVAEMWRAPSG